MGVGFGVGFVMIMHFKCGIAHVWFENRPRTDIFLKNYCLQLRNKLFAIYTKIPAKKGIGEISLN